MYDKKQFEAAFQLITAVAHQVIKIDFASVESWVDKLLGQDALNNDDRREAMNNLKVVMGEFDKLKQVLFKHGIPVRDISHFRESQGHIQPPVDTPGANPSQTKT